MLDSPRMKTSAHAWKDNPLFRVIAFLDNTGVQLFNLSDEVDLDGKFVQSEKIFALGTPINAILVAGLAALRGNVWASFTDFEEQTSLLQVMGIGDIGLAANNALVDEASKKVGDGSDSNHVSHVVTTSEAFSHLPLHTEWSAELLQPKSFSDFVDAFESGFPLALFLRLKEAFGLLHRSDPVSATPYPLVEQFLIDGLDRWILQQSDAENHTMLLACGVEPSIIEGMQARGGQTPDAFVDFVVDVIFPVPQTGSHVDEAPLDWLILSYVKNHESVDVDTEKIPFAEKKSEENLTEGSVSDTTRRELISKFKISGPCVWNSNNGEIYLSESNIKQFMRDKPSLVPHEIMVKMRKPWKDPTITTFELEHHYTATELRTIVKKLKELSRGPPDELNALESDLHYSFPPGLLKRIAAANNKASYVLVLMALHSSPHLGQKFLGGSAGDALDASSQDHRKDKDSEKEIVLNTDVIFTQEKELNIEDPSLSSTQLVRRFKLQELKDYVVNVLMESNVARTKKQYANLIIKKRRRCE